MVVLLSRLVPPAVSVVEAFGDPPVVPLFAEESAVIAQAVDKRRREFTGVRACAREALARIGQAPVPLVPGLRGAPIWPVGVVGSMTHCDGYCAAAVATETELSSVGVDAEPASALPPGVLDLVASPQERAHLVENGTLAPALPWDRLLFSAKESVYKTWFPLTLSWLDFTEAELTFRQDADGRSGQFTARILKSVPEGHAPELSLLEGRWLVDRGLVMTAIAVSAGNGGPSGGA